MEARLQERSNYTREEYIDLLESSSRKMEYHDGQIVMMAGATAPHNRITMNLSGLLYNNPNSCEPHGSDQALSLPAFRKYVFPDLMFVCDSDEGSLYDDDSDRFLVNPCLIVEVLSQKTAEYDRTEKFVMYRSLPTFREYILIDSRKMQVESFYREDDTTSWIIQNLWLPEHELTFHTLGKELTLEQIYLRTNLKPVDLFKPSESLPPA